MAKFKSDYFRRVTIPGDNAMEIEITDADEFQDSAGPDAAPTKFLKVKVTDTAGVIADYFIALYESAGELGE